MELIKKYRFEQIEKFLETGTGFGQNFILIKSIMERCTRLKAIFNGLPSFLTAILLNQYYFIANSKLIIKKKQSYLHRVFRYFYVPYLEKNHGHRPKIDD